MATTRRRGGPAGDGVEGTGSSGASRRGGGRGPRNRDARQRILEAALDLFSRHGYHAVGVDAIMERAGLVPSALYNHFKGKRDLFWALMQQEFVTVPERPVEEHAPLRDALVRVAMDALETVRRNPRFTMLVLSEAVHDPEVAQRMAERIMRAGSKVHGLLERRKAAGEIGVADVELAVGFFLTAVTWTGMLLDVFGMRRGGEAQGAMLSDAVWVSAYTEMLLDGIRSRKREDDPRVAMDGGGDGRAGGDRGVANGDGRDAG